MLNQPISDREYEARWDAKSLAKAEEIKADPARLRRAQSAAVRIAQEKQKELTGIKSVAKRANSSETTRKAPISSKNVTKKESRSSKRPGKTGPGFNVFQKI